MKIAVRLASLTLSLAAGGAAYGAERPELRRARMVFAMSTEELSGLTPKKRGYWVVADAAEDHYIYDVQLGQEGTGFLLKKEIDLTKLEGFKAYQDELAAALHVPASDRRLDLEGVAACGDEVYLVNERVRHVLIVDVKKKTITKAPIDFKPELAALLVKGESNAGFEGIAADCDRQKIYLAKERDPRRLFVVDKKTWTVESDADVPLSDRAGQKVINPFTGQGLFEIGPDFADLTFDGGYLYALERNTFEIAKIDPKTLTVTARVSYLESERGLYETGEPFGIAEGLAMTPQTIAVAFDNNHSPLSSRALKAFGIGGERGAVAVFTRPAGF